MKETRVSILMGSESDLPIMQKAKDVLERFGIPVDIQAISAHRSPKKLEQYVDEAPGKGTKVFICGAGMAAHLAGVVAARTTLPVIGVPCMGKSVGGLDSLLSMVQMPRGVPVATVAIDGAENAGILAIQILGLQDPELAQRFAEYKASLS